MSKRIEWLSDDEMAKIVKWGQVFNLHFYSFA